MKKTTIIIVMAVLCLSFEVNAQLFKGRVVDVKDQAPLAGAIIKVQGQKQTALSNDEGNFELNLPSGKHVLHVQYLSYGAKEVVISLPLKAPLLIELTANENTLKEVEINAGYYTVKERERTGSISRITSKEIEKQPVNNVLQAMQANITGVDITQNTGVPGGGFQIRIRGQNSLTQGSEPFYIIDGVPFTSKSLAAEVGGITPNANPLASINPDDIESIEVLKDADATAIYGSRGANGVILITTKRGSAGKTRASFLINRRFAQVGKKLEMMNTSQYLEMRREAKINDNLPITTTDYDINGTWDQNSYTDWQKELIGRTAAITNIQTSLSGGKGNVTYLVGGNYYNEGTVFPGAKSYKRSSGNFSLQYLSENTKLSTSFSSSFSQVNSNLFLNDLTPFVRLPPNYPSLLTEEGLLNWGNNTMGSNPLAQIQKPSDSKTNNLIANASLNYNVVSDLKLKLSFGYNDMSRKEVRSQPLITYNPANNPGPKERVSVFSNNSTSSWIFEPQADYVKKIGLSKFSALLGATFQQSLRDDQSISASGYNSDVLMGDLAAGSTFNPRTNFSKYRYSAVFGRFNFTYKNKYVINATGRRDGSSRFGINNRFANFGAIGLAWVISEEGFIKEQLPFITFAKLRGSIGITGNDQISDYGYQELWRSSAISYQGLATMFPGNLANPNYEWEQNKKTEGALELGFLKDQINLSVSYYSNRSSNQLVLKPLSYITGFGGVTDNLPAKIGNTGWEFELHLKKLTSNLFKWSTSINLTIPKNKLIAFPEFEKSSYTNQYIIGQPLSIVKLYKTNIDSQTGLYRAEDFDGNGIIDINDRSIVEFIGREFYGGMRNSLSYKGVTLDLLFQFVKQKSTGFLDGFYAPGSFSTGIPTRNQPSILVDRWMGLEDHSKYQKYSTTSASNNSYQTAVSSGSYATDDSSFIRLNNISISYDLPTRFIQKIKLSNAKFFIQGQNLFTITNYKGYDPETSTINSLPTLRVFTTGFQITL